MAIGDQELAAPAEVATSGDDMVLLGIRAEYIQASSPNGATPNGLEAEALVVEPLGRIYSLRLALATSGRKS